MTKSRKPYILSLFVLLGTWAAIYIFAPDINLWYALTTGVAFVIGFWVLIPALFGPLDDSLKKWQR